MIDVADGWREGSVWYPDGYISTGQDINGLNMFVYCGNNPVNRVDSTGHFWKSVLEFAKTAVSGIRDAFSASAPAHAGIAATALVDGPLPFMDVVAAAGVSVLTASVITQGIGSAINARRAAKEERI